MLSRDIKIRLHIHTRSETENLDDIESSLEGHVFHVTKLAYLPSIIECGEIRPNADGAFPTTFGSSAESFFRKRNYIPLFDYRAEPTDRIKQFRERCYPFTPARKGKGPIAILIISQEVYKDLVPWNKWHEEEAYEQMVIPYIEAGYPDPLSIDFITEIIIVKVLQNQDRKIFLDSYINK